MMNSLPATIYIVDDDASVRESLSALIRAAGMTALAFDAPEKFLAFAPLADMACALFDVKMPGLDGLALQEKLIERKIDIPIIFITGHGDVPLAVRAIKAGAIDFLNKPFDDTSLLEAIDAALSKACLLRETKTVAEALHRHFADLTPREKQVVIEVAKGRRNKQIAYDFELTESTVKVHKHNAMKKMQVRSVAELTLAIDHLRKLGELS